MSQNRGRFYGTRVSLIAIDRVSYVGCGVSP